MPSAATRSDRSSAPASCVPDYMLIMAYLGGMAELVVQHVTGSLPELADEVHRFTDALFFPASR